MKDNQNQTSFSDIYKLLKTLTKNSHIHNFLILEKEVINVCVISTISFFIFAIICYLLV